MGSTRCIKRNVRYIGQSMWEYEAFRNEVQQRVERALSWIGMPAEASVVLVGFTLDTFDETGQHRLCVEPADGRLSVGLVTVADRANELFDAVPESRKFYGDPKLYELGPHVANLRRLRADALAPTIEASGVFDGLTFSASSSWPINGYEWHTCVGVPTAALDSALIPRDSVGNHFYEGLSLPHEVIDECLRRADRGLALRDPGEYLYSRDVSEDVARAAAEQLTERILRRVAGVDYSFLFTLTNVFTSLSYERAGASGRLVVASRDKAISLSSVRFAQPILLNNARIVRKLVQLSDDRTAVLTDGLHAYGLGECVSAQDVVEVFVCDHAEWELRVGGNALLRVAYGHARLPKPLFDWDKFAVTAERTVGPVDLFRIREIIEAAQDSGHGMTLVVSRNVAEEVDRLGGEAVPINPDDLEVDDIVRFGRVDGAVVLGTDGRCYAFGVILDGRATGRGDPARGSRYNSAVRYQTTMAPKSVIVVISDDRTVDLIP